MKKSNPLIIGTLLLAFATLITKLLGFIYRVWLSRLIGSEGMGIYQLVFPILGICYSICCVAIQTSISKFIAQSKNKYYYRIGLFLSLALSLFCAFILWQGAYPISRYFLLERQCTNLLKIIAISLPFNSIHSCICGYYLGYQKSTIPAISQLVEQSFRMLFLFTISSIVKDVTVETAIWALVIGEIAAAIFCTLSIQIHFSLHKKEKCKLAFFDQLQNLLTLAIPLSASRLILSLLQSIEVIMIPSRLRLFGLSASDALSIYGIFCGMAMPFILFPNALTSALSMMLLPEVATEHSNHNHKKITYTATRSSEYCLYMGILCTAVFFLLGNSLGDLFFPNTKAGIFIRTLSFICPFLYLNNTYTSILNGLGKATLTFSHQLAGIVLRLFCVVFIIPRIGIIGYFLGILLGDLLTCGLNYQSLHQLIQLTYNKISAIFRPIIAILFASFSVQFINPFLPPFFLIVVKGSIICIIYLTILFITRRKSSNV